MSEELLASARRAAGAAATSNGEELDPLVWDSFMWGLVSAVSLNIGSVIGVTCLPGQRTRAVLMSFGGGALLFALSIELFGNALHHMEADGDTAPVWAMEASAVFGGLFFALLNYVLNVSGADVRKPSTTKSRFARLRALMLRRLAHRIWKIPFFSVLSIEELRDLIQSAMYKQRFSAGDIIMSDGTGEHGIFFVISGRVCVQVYGRQTALRDEASPLPGQSAIFSESGHKDPKAALKRVNSLASEDGDEPLSEWHLGANQIFGNMTVLTGSYLKTVAFATQGTKVLVLPGHELAHLLEQNDAVRDQVALHAVERLRQVPELQRLPDHALASLAAQCTLERFQPGDVVFRGLVDERTAVICLLLGCVEVKYEDGRRKVLHGSRMMCTEHLKTGMKGTHIVATAIESTSALIIERLDINAAMAMSPSPTALRVLDEVYSDEGCHCIVPGQLADLSPMASASDPQEVGQAIKIIDLEDASKVSPSRASRADASWDAAEVKRDSMISGFQAWTRKTSVSKSNEAPGLVIATNNSSVTAMFKAVGQEDTVQAIGHHLGWDESSVDKETDTPLPKLKSIDMGQITELDMVEEDPSAIVRRPSEEQLQGRSWSRKTSVRVTEAINRRVVRDSVTGNNLVVPGSNPTTGLSPRSIQSEGPCVSTEHHDGSAAALCRSAADSVNAVADNGKPAELMASVQVDEMEDRPTLVEKMERAGSKLVRQSSKLATHAAHTLHQRQAQHRAVMVWLGILIDAVPESLVIGIIINKSATEGEGDPHMRAAAAALPFVIGVFLSNLPESMSSSGSMKAHGMRVPTILLMWLATTVLTALGACLGAVLFPPGSGNKEQAILVASVEGLAAGAMLTMIAQTMMPEAFEQGGDVVGLSCLAGFLSALTVKLIPVGE